VQALGEHDVVGGRCATDRLNPPWLIEQRNLPQQDSLQPGLPPLNLPHVGSGNLGLRRQVFERVGGFRPDVPVLGDTDLSWRLQQAGYVLTFARDAVVNVRFRPTLSAAYHQGRAYGIAEQLLMRLHGGPSEPRRLVREAVVYGGLTWLRLLVDAVRVRNRGQLHAWTWGAGWRTGRFRGWRANLRAGRAGAREADDVAPPERR
jgi:hypothetical protein